MFSSSDCRNSSSKSCELVEIDQLKLGSYVVQLNIQSNLVQHVRCEKLKLNIQLNLVERLLEQVEQSAGCNKSDPVRKSFRNFRSIRKRRVADMEAERGGREPLS